VVPVLRDINPVILYSDESNLGGHDESGPLLSTGEILYRQMEAFKSMYGSYAASAVDAAGRPASRNPNWDRLSASPRDFRPLVATGSEAQVGPLLTASWHQGAPYNGLCPEGDGGRTLVPSPVVAAAQIMQYWQWPPRGVFSREYVWPGDDSCDDSLAGQTLSADFSHPYDWASMPDNCDAGCTQAEMDALAALCYDLAIADKTDFGFCKSSAPTYRLRNVLPGYFRYRASAHYEQRGLSTPRHEWWDIIRGEIDAGRPLIYSVPYHCLACDGYRDDGSSLEVHMNYGWNDGFNAWYVLDSLYCSYAENDLCPASLERMIAGIEPQVEPILDFAFYSVADPAGNGDGMAQAGEQVGLTVTIQNLGNDAIDVVGTLSSDDEFVSVLSPSAAFGPSVAWGEFVASQTPFVIEVSPDCPDPYLADFELALSAGNDYSDAVPFSLYLSNSPGLDDDIESGDAGWVHYTFRPGYTDEWHLETLMAHSGSTSWNMGGLGTAGFSSDADGGLITRPLLLPPDGKLTFWHWMIAPDWQGYATSGGAVEISTDGINWTRIYPEGGYPREFASWIECSLGTGTPCYSHVFGWNEAVFDLSAYSGVVQIIFRFAHGYTVGEGWYIDDVWVGNTMTGTDIVVHSPEGAAVTFDEVLSRGNTTIALSGTGPEAPAGHVGLPETSPVYYEVSSDVAYSGLIGICINYDDSGLDGDEDKIRLLHHDGVEWTDITTSLDTEANQVCGTSSAFSAFLVTNWVDCCQGRVGDANGSGDADPTIGDIIALIDMLFISEEPVVCLPEADINQSGGADPSAEDITISDISMLIDYLFITGSSLALPDCL
jgi:hypothetical protein